MISLLLSLAGMAFASPITPGTRAALDELAQQVRTWTLTCPDGTQTHKADNCPFGDMVIFSGISCLAGDETRCEDVRRAQGPDGRWWRSPGFIGQEKVNAFSRDQTLGVLAYLVATRDREAATRWLAWIDSHGGKVCAIDKQHTCWVSFNLWGLFGDVWRYLGLKPTWKMRIAKVSDFPTELIQSMLTPRGFQMHLVGVHNLIRYELRRRGLRRAYRPFWHEIPVQLAHREPENPFFRWLRDGATEEVAQIVLEKCPREMPQNQWTLDWAWQRATRDRAWERASGYDCLFMIRLLERSEQP